MQRKRPRADIVVWNNQKRDLRLSELPLELQEYMEDTIVSVVPRHRALYRFFDVHDWRNKAMNGNIAWHPFLLAGRYRTCTKE